MYSVTNESSFRDILSILGQLKKKRRKMFRVLVIGNFNDLKYSREVEKSKAEKFCVDRGFDYYEMSCLETKCEHIRETVGKFLLSKCISKTYFLLEMYFTKTGKLLEEFSKFKIPSGNDTHDQQFWNQTMMLLLENERFKKEIARRMSLFNAIKEKNVLWKIRYEQLYISLSQNQTDISVWKLVASANKLLPKAVEHNLKREVSHIYQLLGEIMSRDEEIERPEHTESYYNNAIRLIDSGSKDVSTIELEKLKKILLDPVSDFSNETLYLSNVVANEKREDFELYWKKNLSHFLSFTESDTGVILVKSEMENELTLLCTGIKRVKEVALKEMGRVKIERIYRESEPYEIKICDEVQSFRKCDNLQIPKSFLKKIVDIVLEKKDYSAFVANDLKERLNVDLVDEYFKIHETNSVIHLPILLLGEVVGSLLLTSRRKGSYTIEIIDALTDLVSSLSINMLQVFGKKENISGGVKFMSMVEDSSFGLCEIDYSKFISYLGKFKIETFHNTNVFIDHIKKKVGSLETFLKTAMKFVVVTYSNDLFELFNGNILKIQRANFFKKLLNALILKKFAFVSNYVEKKSKKPMEYSWTYLPSKKKGFITIHEVKAFHELLNLNEEARQRRFAKEIDYKYNRELFDTISHGTLNPLQMISGILPRLKEIHKGGGSISDKEEAALLSKQMICACNTQSFTFENTIDMDVIKNGKMEVNLSEVRLKDVFDIVVEEFSMKADCDKLKTFHARVDIDEETIVFTDKTVVLKILRNYLFNAFKFTQTGNIQLVLRKNEKMKELESEEEGEKKIDEEWVEFNVRDTGIGIKEEDISKIFKQFSHADEEVKSRYGGTGVGLYLCMEMAKLIGVKLGCHSVYKKGSNFHVIFKLPKKKKEM